MSNGAKIETNSNINSGSKSALNNSVSASGKNIRSASLNKRLNQLDQTLINPTGSKATGSTSLTIQ